jgi:hypothetical protein
MKQQTMDEKTKALYKEYLSTSALHTYHAPKKAGYIRRLRNTARQISLSSQEDTMSIMRLSNLETRLGIELEWL